MAISLENLKHFVAAVENQGVIRASEKVFISPSSITRSIQQIESEVGHPLFDRVGRTLTLNQEGRRFPQKARDLIHQYALLLHPGLPDGELRGHYRIGASHFLCEHLLAGLIASLVERLREATFEVYSFDTMCLLKKLQEGEIDLGFAFSPKSAETIESRPVREGQLLLCANKKHPLMGKSFSAVREQLGDYPAIIHHPVDSIERCDNHPMFRRHQISPSIRVYWDSDYFALALLGRGNYWSMLPDWVIEASKGIAAFRHPGLWSAPYQVMMLWNKRKAVSDLREAATSALKN
jgi:DNA-binding transcriptional LysR family regulator